jgi:cytochrome c oxidase cbb3-type subunit 3
MLSVCVLAATLSGCSVEKRSVGPTPPSSPPTGPADARQGYYAGNRYEQSEGGRLFRWAGCDACHDESSKSARNLADDRWAHGGTPGEIYRTIAQGAPGMPGYDARLTSQELWQLSGYIASLHKTKPSMRRRSGNAQAGEPSGAAWAGALR